MSTPYRRLLELADYLTTWEGKALYKSHYQELLQYRRELHASGWGDRDTTLSEMREDARGWALGKVCLHLGFEASDIDGNCFINTVSRLNSVIACSVNNAPIQRALRACLTL